jgi:hypothetical protein
MTEDLDFRREGALGAVGSPVPWGGKLKLTPLGDLILVSTRFSWRRLQRRSETLSYHVYSGDLS